MHSRKKKIDEIVDANKIRAKEKKLQTYVSGMSKVQELRLRAQHDAECSEELLSLCEQLLLVNPDVYTLWNIRKAILCKRFTLPDSGSGSDPVPVVEIDKDMYKAEMNLTEQCLRVNPKSYGAWYHRQWVFTRTPECDGPHELTLCNTYLELDGRNFHCWDYHRFIVQQSQCDLAKELEYTKSLIEANMSNYSSWYYRSKLLPVVHPSNSGIQVCNADKHSASNIHSETLQEECELVQNAVFTDSNDSSAWFYLTWLLTSHYNSDSNGITGVHYHGSTERLIVCSMLPVAKIDGVLSISVLCDGSEVDVGEWSSPALGSHCASSIWVCPLTLPHGDGKHAFTIGLGGTSQACLQLTPGEDASYICEDEVRRLIQPAVTPQVTQLIREMSDMCQQLLELEPDNKWCLRLMVEVVRRHDANPEQQLHRLIEQLLEQDPDKLPYYNDMRSRLSLESVLKQRLAVEGGLSHSEVSVSGLKLTRLYYMNCLSHVTNLDLSNNQLVSLTGIESLQLLRSLAVNNNVLVSLEPLTSLQSLTVLNISHNAFPNSQPVIHYLECVQGRQPRLMLEVRLLGHQDISNDIRSRQLLVSDSNITILDN